MMDRSHSCIRNLNFWDWLPLFSKNLIMRRNYSPVSEIHTKLGESTTCTQAIILKLIKEIVKVQQNFFMKFYFINMWLPQFNKLINTLRVEHLRTILSFVIFLKQIYRTGSKHYICSVSAKIQIKLKFTFNLKWTDYMFQNGGVVIIMTNSFDWHGNDFTRNK